MRTEVRTTNLTRDRSIGHDLTFISIDIAPISCCVDNWLCPAGDRPN
ncbi:hypothetical protein IQ269_01830 [Tychonema sp. LEGE 07199]|nr:MULTISPECIES: hypothetical protein [unclassified Tychonema]MBE9119573.1 hypothetical protein [Tychonema sp. LEGE 07199]MBE9131777.1 hypothetical protein [Tychonema sp. LEGE 07196]